MKALKVISIVFFLLVVFSLGAFILTGKLQHPEKVILGDWKETAWNYEKVDKNHPDEDHDVKHIEEEIKSDISKDLVIHESEKWLFQSNSTLTLFKKDGNPVHLKWRLKGRGHILKLTYDNDLVEYYNIKELSKDRMVLHFENDIHARGIVKIVFTKEKKGNYVTKI